MNFLENPDLERPGFSFVGDATVEKVTMFYFKTFPGPLRAMGFLVPN
jgi:hypothetical protein